MEMTNYSLSQSFEILGQWTPDYRNFNNTVSGTLSYDPVGIRLEMYGSFAPHENIHELFGFTQDGHFIWIAGLVTQKTDASIPGYSVKEYTVRDCFIFEEERGYFQNEPSVVFTKIFQRISNLVVKKLLRFFEKK